MQRVASRSSQITVLVADDHPMYRAAVARLVLGDEDLVLVGESSDGADALQQARETAPDVALLDVRMPGLGGLDVLRELGGRSAVTRVVLLTAIAEPSSVLEALSAGARGYLVKTATDDEIAAAVRAVHHGDVALPEELRSRVLPLIGSDRAALSDREREVLSLVALGLSGVEIGGRLYLSPATVKTYMRRIYVKLEVDDRAAAVATAMRRNLIA